MNAAVSFDPASAAGILARLERIPVARWHLKARAILGVGLLFDAFDLLAISFALPAFVNEWHLSPSQIGWVLSAAFIGQLLGALAAGWLADRFGRLIVITVAIGVFSMMSSDSQAMGRVSEVILRTWQTADKMVHCTKISLTFALQHET